MCGGPSNAEKQAQASEQNFMQTLMSNYNNNQALQQSALAHINSILAPIIAAGPSQEGFSASERAALNTQAINSTGAAAAQAQRAIANETAGRNDSGNLPESGVDRALKARAASASANQLANEELGITEADYGTGRQNFENAVGAELGVSGQYNPDAIAGAANNANSAAFQEADTISQESNQGLSDVLGGITGLAGAGLSFAGGFMGGGGLKGGLKALGGAL